MHNYCEFESHFVGPTHNLLSTFLQDLKIRHFTIICHLLESAPRNNISKDFVKIPHRGAGDSVSDPGMCKLRPRWLLWRCLNFNLATESKLLFNIVEKSLFSSQITAVTVNK